MREYYVHYETPDGRMIYEMFAASTVTELAEILNEIEGTIINLFHMGTVQ